LISLTEVVLLDTMSGMKDQKAQFEDEVRRKIEKQEAQLERRAREDREVRRSLFKTVADWLEHLGLAVAASVVFQKIVSGAPLRDPVVIIGSISALVVYATAVVMLLRK
jgi:hypothetical protein